MKVISRERSAFSGINYVMVEIPECAGTSGWKLAARLGEIGNFKYAMGEEPHEVGDSDIATVLVRDSSKLKASIVEMMDREISTVEIGTEIEKEVVKMRVTVWGDEPTYVELRAESEDKINEIIRKMGSFVSGNTV